MYSGSLVTGLPFGCCNTHEPNQGWAKITRGNVRCFSEAYLHVGIHGVRASIVPCGLCPITEI